MSDGQPTYPIFNHNLLESILSELGIRNLTYYNAILMDFQTQDDIDNIENVTAFKNILIHRKYMYKIIQFSITITLCE